MATAAAGDYQRLPSDPSPVHYDLTYHWVSLEGTTEFEGAVEVLLSFLETFASSTRTTIRLNALNLSIVSAKLKVNQTVREAVKITILPKLQEVELEFAEATEAGDALLMIEFRGRLNGQLAGFYKSKLTDTSIMGVTQFEATDARRAFPCWDDPARKATFKLKMTSKPEALVLSNTRPKSKKFTTSKWPSGQTRDGVTWEFYETPKMSTYLLAWVVAPDSFTFDSLSVHSKKAPFIETVVYVPQGKLPQAEFASLVGVKALDYFTEMFDIEYPLPLMQHIACVDFAAGAMENFGLITYRNVRLLVDPQTTTSTSRRDVARVVCHELAHQWFGNSTTMEWWTDLWLNEGFARFCEFLGVDHIFPELDVWTTFDLEVVGTALRLDALKSSHAIRVDVKHPDEINEIFDAVSYAKGGTVLRMLTHFLGGLDVFVKGVRLYLKQFRYQNAVSDDLWRALEKGAGKPEGSIVNIMRSWTTQVGYPVINVQVEGSKNVKLSQRRYFTVAPDSLVDTTKWTIPVTLLSASSPEKFFSVTPGEESEELTALVNTLRSLESENKWFVLNGKGDLFRVCYTEEQWKRIAREACAQLKVSNRTRLSLVRDAFDLAESGDLPIGVALDFGLTLLGGQSKELDPIVLLQTVSKLNSLVLTYSGEIFSPSFNQLVQNNLSSLLTILGPWTTVEGHFDKSVDANKIDDLRIAVLRCAVDSATDESEFSIARDSFDKLKLHCAGKVPCPNDLRPAIFRMAATYSGTETLNLLLSRYDKAESQEQREIFSSFGGLRTEEDIKRAVAFTRSEKVRSQDVPMCVNALAGNKLGARLLWSDFNKDFQWWFSKFSDGNFLWSGIVGSIAAGLPTEAEAQEVVNFFQVYPSKLGSAKRALDQAVEKVRAKEAQLKRDRLHIQKFLDEWKA